MKVICSILQVENERNVLLLGLGPFGAILWLIQELTTANVGFIERIPNHVDDVNWVTDRQRILVLGFLTVPTRWFFSSDSFLVPHFLIWSQFRGCDLLLRSN